MGLNRVTVLILPSGEGGCCSKFLIEVSLPTIANLVSILKEPLAMHIRFGFCDGR